MTKDNRDSQQNNCRSVLCIVVAVLFVSSAVAVAALIGGKKHSILIEFLPYNPSFYCIVGIIDPMQRNAQGYKDGRSRDISTTTTVRSEPITQEVLSKEATKFNRIPETSIENVLEESFPSWAGKKKEKAV